MTANVKKIIDDAQQLAYANQHQYLTVDHIMLYLLGDSEVLDILAALPNPVSLAEIRGEIQDNLKATPKNSDPRMAIRTTDAVELWIQTALVYSRNSRRTLMESKDLLVALFDFDEESCFSKYVFSKRNISQLDITSYISHGQKESVTATEAPTQEKPKNKLPDYLVNLNDRARDGKIDKMIGRQNEVERVVQSLVRRKKNNPILVGEPGVGKTAIAEGLALRIVKGEVPDKLKTAIILSLDVGSLMAGTKYRGDFEERMKYLIKILKSNPKAVLFIDEIHTIIGAGAAGGSALDASNMLKPMLASGEIRVIGATTYKEFRNVFEKDVALARRFQKVDVVEPTPAETKEILKNCKGDLEKHHGVTYETEALEAAVDLSVKHINDRFLPDKAIDLLDEAGAVVQLSTDSSKVVTKLVVEKLIAKIARIPEKTVSSSQKDKLKDLEQNIKTLIYGQNDAVESVVTSIELSQAGLRNGEKPIGSFLFCGPTGVGKTELAKQLALNLGVPFIRFDMSEYSEKHTVSRLVGSPPGYVGHDEGGQLTEAILKNPHAVVLLDELEKAHPDLWNILLQVMDHGTLTDTHGRKADFKNAIIIMTTNVGAMEMNKRSLGLATSEASAKRPTEAVERTFTPEFRNRLDAVVYFNSLGREQIDRVLEKYLTELKSQLLSKEVMVEFSAEAKAHLATKGYDPLMGARPMGRVIQDEIKRPLAKELLYGKLEKGGVVKIGMDGDKVTFTFKAKTKKKVSDEEPQETP